MLILAATLSGESPCMTFTGQTWSQMSEADLANMLIIEAVPLAITEGFDAGIVVAACSAPRMDHDRKQLKGKQTLKIKRRTLLR